MIEPFDISDFEDHYNSGHTQLLTRWIPSDMDTPVSAFLKLCADQPHSFLLESVEGGKTLGRYSVIGMDPDLIWTCRNGAGYTERGENSKTQDSQAPLPHLRALLKECAIDAIPPGAPPMASSGLFGMMGYDMIRLVEDIPDSNPDPLDIPDALMIRPCVMVIFDNVKSQICIALPVFDHAKREGAPSAADALNQAKKRYQKVIEAFNAPLHLSPAKTHMTKITVDRQMQDSDFKAMVARSIDYIRAGDIFQVVPSQRMSFDFDLQAFDLYRSLRRLNPSPFLFYFNFGAFSLVGSSPEIMVRVQDRQMTIRPLAGTRPRGKSPAQDKALADELLNDAKERAEHLMLLDLGRNDIGRVCEIGSVEVTDAFTIEYYSHVMHIISNVTGRLRQDCDIIDAFFAGFPLGTVSGAPKIRAMEIIDELEPLRRKFYSGAVGYLSGSGEMDTCVALRTALVKNGVVTVQAGGGVVADSDADFEYQESLNKAEAIIQAARDAIDLAGGR